MVNSNQSLTVHLKPGSIRDIERFADRVCDQLFINDTYYGTLLMALTEIFGLLLEHQDTDSFIIEYNTDYQDLNIKIYPVSGKIYEQFDLYTKTMEFYDNQGFKEVFLIKSLVDGVELQGGDIILLSFDISAMHDEVYEKRKAQLKDYFNVNQDIKVKNTDD